jgi:hypothetical protein
MKSGLSIIGKLAFFLNFFYLKPAEKNQLGKNIDW